MLVSLGSPGRSLAVALAGRLSIHYRPDPNFAYGLNLPGVFSGKVANRANIGKTPEELINLWNEAFPEDPVPPNP